MKRILQNNKCFSTDVTGLAQVVEWPWPIIACHSDITAIQRLEPQDLSQHGTSFTKRWNISSVETCYLDYDFTIFLMASLECVAAVVTSWSASGET